MTELNEGRFWRQAAEWSGAGVPFVVATVVSVRGSTPREAGAKLIWRPDGSVLGTVGGGQLEALVIEAAAGYFEHRTCATERFRLGTDAGQCCGGTVDVFFEYCGSRQRVLIFGAGHVAHALASILSGLALDLVVVDQRPDWNSKQRFADARRLSDYEEGIRLAHSEPESAFACIMTHSHDLDLQLLHKLLATPPYYVGLIGSRPKRACLFQRLAARGLERETVQRVQCPMGIGDTGKSPKQVAVSIAAKLLLEIRAHDNGRSEVGVR